LELATLTRATWPPFMKAVGVKSTDDIPKEELAAYIDLLKREDNGKAFLKIMRNFEQTEELTAKCYSAIKNKSYPVQLIWGEKDPFLSWEKHGIPFFESRPDAKVYKLPSKHFVMEEYPEFISEKIKEITSGSDGL
jgi:pimeloyl-ACP methyl ester carboxylesterase